MAILGPAIVWCAAFRERRGASNYSFKPKPLRYGKKLAKKACQLFSSATRFGLTQVLGLKMIAMVALLLAAQTVTTSTTPVEFSDALKRADTNEDALDLAVKATLVRSQDAALKASMASCVDLAPGKLPNFTVVLQLDSAGHSLNSWRNNNVPMVRCVERELAKGSYPTNQSPDSFMSFVVTFEP